jgi:uncharacterized protein YgiM (DUF1202 family)
MSRRSIRIAILAAAAFSATATFAARGQDAAPDAPALKEVENSKFSTSGIVSSNAVYVRCGPGDNYYPTMKLDKGAPVKVVGAKFDWLKIVPPDGSFCYVAKVYVDRHGDGKVGRVARDSINVRAGSSLSALKIGILCELNLGEEVEILGEEQEYLRIKPPAKAFLYVNKKFVEPDPDAKPEVQQIANAGAPKPIEQPKAETPKPADTTPPAPVTGAAGQDFGTPEAPKTEAPKPETATTDVPAAVKPEVTTPTPAPEAPKPEATNPIMAKADPVPPPAVIETPKPIEAPKPETTDKPEPIKETPAPVTEAPKVEAPKFETPKVEAPKIETPAPQVEAPKPVVPAKPTFPVPTTLEAAEMAFDKAEGMFGGTKGVALDQQPLDSLVAQFEALHKSDALPESLRRVAEARLRTVKTRQSAQVDLFQVRQGQDELSKRRMALAAEQAELQRRISENTVRIYQAVGTLQPSSFQQGKGVLYRLTDPATGRTVCYVRSQDATQSTQIGQFVGVKGQITEDNRLGAKVLIPTEVTACDPGKVHQTITAQIIPPSLMPKEPAQATTSEPQPQQ